MKLLFVIHQFFPECRSGTEQYCLAVAREARRRGDEVVVFSLEPWCGPEHPPFERFERGYDGFRVVRLRHHYTLQPNQVVRDFHNPLVAVEFGKVLAAERPDAVHFFHLRQLGTDLLEVAADAGVRTVVNLMDFWYLCPRFTLLRSDGTLCDGPPRGGLGCVSCHEPELAGAFDDEVTGPAALDLARSLAELPSGNTRAERFAALMMRPRIMLERLALADRVIAPSRFLAEMFRKNGFAGDSVQVVPYGLEPGRAERRDVTRPRDPLRVAFAGVLSPWKAPHLVVEAVRGIDGPLRLDVRGDLGMEMFADYIAKVRAAAGDDPRIRFPGGFDHAQLSDVLEDTDVLVVPSIWYENTPFVVLEAFEAGVPVIASDLGGLSEVVVEGVNGLLFTAGDSGALAAALRRCLDEPDLLAGMRPAPQASVAANYDAFLPHWSGGES